MNRSRILVAAIMASGLIAAGCGGDDDETTTTATTEEAATGATGATGAAADVSPERAALIEEADAICAEGDAEIDAEGEQVFGESNEEPPASEQEAFIEDTVIPNIQDQLDQLRELDAPEEDAAEFEGIIEDAQAALDEVADDPGALVGGDDPFAEVNERARAFGLEDCGS